MIDCFIFYPKLQTFYSLDTHKIILIYLNLSTIPCRTKTPSSAQNPKRKSKPKKPKKINWNNSNTTASLLPIPATLDSSNNTSLKTPPPTQPSFFKLPKTHSFPSSSMIQSNSVSLTSNPSKEEKRKNKLTKWLGTILRKPNKSS